MTQIRIIANRVEGKPNGMVAGCKAAWNEKGLALVVRLKDANRVLFPEEWKKQGAESRLWSHDWAVEVYIDTFGDGRASAAKGYGDDDYRYDFAPSPDGKSGRAKVWRTRGVNQQLADGLGSELGRNASRTHSAGRISRSKHRGAYPGMRLPDPEEL